MAEVLAEAPNVAADTYTEIAVKKGIGSLADTVGVSSHADRNCTSTAVESTSDLSIGTRRLGVAKKPNPFICKRKKSPSPQENVLISDSQENDSSSAHSKYQNLLDSIEKCTNGLALKAPPGEEAGQTEEPYTSLDKVIVLEPSCSSGSQTTSTNCDNEITDNSSITWEDSFLFPSQGSQTDKPKPGSPNLLDAVLECPQPSTNCDILKRHLSPDLTYTRLKRRRRIRTSTIDSPRYSSQSSQRSTSSLCVEDVLVNTGNPIANTPTRSCHTEVPNDSCHLSPVTTSCHVTQIADPTFVTPKVQVTPSDSVWSLNDSELLQLDKPVPKDISAGGDGTAESNDLFSSKLCSVT